MQLKSTLHRVVVKRRNNQDVRIINPFRTKPVHQAEIELLLTNPGNFRILRHKPIEETFEQVRI